MMDAEEVERLLDDYRRRGDRAARNRVVEGHLSLARFTVRRLARGNPALAEDLQQVALLAIVHAADRYRPGKGASFRTFAGRTIDGELKRHLRDKTWAVRPPRTRQEHYLRVCRAREELTQELHRGPTPSEIAERTDLLRDEVLAAMEAGGARTSNPLEPARDGDDAGPVRPEVESWDLGFGAFESHCDLSQAIGVLDERERCVLGMRFVEERSQPEIAVELGISQSYVSRIIRGALAKLREHMDAERSVGSPATTGAST
ncbi:sigma-70 family RNA polymerase sigma factor [Dermatobacter hominis]|uniref:sigma-70 family RNA polymerase sigma factor n=1 Tax=Dermatobacter hominis TaxID=2884263 RepID=UPI001D11818E|nr:sigma-70 family RNA polymerase sigma factor [Dermatobacter hominis]UDY37506.1 sigma-70 family RNA polymerase sigma factor [Dermatobacter hominis]